MKEKRASAASPPTEPFPPEVHLSVIPLQVKIFTRSTETAASLQRKATIDVDDSPTKRTQMLVKWLGEYASLSDSTHEDDNPHEDDSIIEDDSDIENGNASEDNKATGTTVQSAWSRAP